MPDSLYNPFSPPEKNGRNNNPLFYLLLEREKYFYSESGSSSDNLPVSWKRHSSSQYPGFSKT